MSFLLSSTRRIFWHQKILDSGQKISYVNLLYMRGITWDQVNFLYLSENVLLKKTFLSLRSINSRLVFDTQLDKANLLASKIFGFGPKNFLCKFTIHEGDHMGSSEFPIDIHLRGITLDQVNFL